MTQLHERGNPDKIRVAGALARPHLLRGGQQVQMPDESKSRTRVSDSETARSTTEYNGSCAA
ncbi:hypothetical protein [Kibdelosporangium philippinense]|uniref:hypothetical protein n=1 Tax=Kibdelosporangium philippinense TaxID=211113 RepID=UPI003613ABE6